ncbi:hypothetical protein I7I48_02393 [Histoplasma ohiense]|nr:hypothetical protein I7I48_02393 [Histoplasma ohiense (nom. inval.)]
MVSVFHCLWRWLTHPTPVSYLEFKTKREILARQQILRTLIISFPTNPFCGRRRAGNEYGNFFQVELDNTPIYLPEEGDQRLP